MKTASLGLHILILATCTTSPVLASDSPARPIKEVTDFGANPGNLRMWIHVPPGVGEGAPLVVVAHGCFQTVEQVVDHAGWIETADRNGFALLFPQTDKNNESFGGCFRTWYPEHQKRGRGEPLSIRNQIAWMVKHLKFDSKRIFMAGQSSGGLVTSVMLASYPEVFAAGAVESAYPYRCADVFEDLGPCSHAKKTKSAEEWGALVRAAAPDYRGPRPPISIWHGKTDELLFPANLKLQLEQWANVLNVDIDKSTADSIDGQQRHRYADKTGSVLIETVMVSKMGHAIAIDPNGSPPCGRPAPYIEDAGICAAAWIGRWFGIVPTPESSLLLSR